LHCVFIYLSGQPESRQSHGFLGLSRSKWTGCG